jgi:PAS domain S-box-containing protein
MQPARSQVPQIFRAIWEHSADAMVLSDDAGTVVSANPAYLALHGFPAEEVIGKHFTVIYPPERRATAQERYAEIFRTLSLQPRFEAQVQHKDGSLHYVESNATFIYEHGRPVAILSITRDITEKKALELAYANMLAREQHALAEAKRAVSVRDNFLSIASHELRGQLTILSGNAQLLHRRLSARDLAPAEAQLLKMVIDQASYLTEALDELFDLSLIEQGRISLNRMEIDIDILLRQIVARISPTLTQHTLIYEAPKETLTIEGDPMRLEQVFQNLIQNAVKYSPHGGRILVCVERQEQRALITVVDEGIGIPASALPHLFNQFFRAANTSQQNIRGSGIGLYVAKEIVASHNGFIRAASVEGQSSTFTVELPLIASGSAVE